MPVGSDLKQYIINRMNEIQQMYMTPQGQPNSYEDLTETEKRVLYKEYEVLRNVKQICEQRGRF